MYNTIYETIHQSRFDAQYWMLGAGALGQPRGIVQGRRREQIHVDIWQNQYNIVKLKNKIKKKRKLWFICTMEYYSAIKKNTFESVLMRWMKQEPII